jgi:hypothetical protein
MVAVNKDRNMLTYLTGRISICEHVSRIESPRFTLSHPKQTIPTDPLYDLNGARHFFSLPYAFSLTNGCLLSSCALHHRAVIKLIGSRIVDDVRAKKPAEAGLVGTCAVLKDRVVDEETTDQVI